MKIISTTAVLVSFISASALAAPKSANVPAKVKPQSETKVMSALEEGGMHEDWKGQPENSVIGLGALAGLGVFSDQAGFTLLGSASAKILQDGFIPDINDSASVEVELGPIWVASRTLLQFSGHLRWDLHKDASWSFYALGGIGGNSGSGIFVLYPRVGVGATYDMAKNFVLRAEVSHEMLGLGLMFPFWF